MNQKTAKLINKVFGSHSSEAIEYYNSLSSKERREVKDRMKLFINTEDKDSLLRGSSILSDVKLEE